MEPAIVIEDAGSIAPWLVMVHGMSQDHRIFNSQVAAFRPRYRILLIDLPGHGLAKGIDGPYGHMEFARHVHAMMRKNISSPANYWGTHTGTAAGLLLASSEPDLFNSLILEGPVMPGRNVPIVVAEIARVRQVARRDGAVAAIEAWWSKACWFDYMKANPVECRADQQHKIVSGFSARPWTDERTPMPVEIRTRALEFLMIPTLIYNGDTDHPDFLAEAERLTGLLPNAQRWVAPAAGGFPAWERPDTVNARIEKFLAGLLEVPS